MTDDLLVLPRRRFLAMAAATAVFAKLGRTAWAAPPRAAALSSMDQQDAQRVQAYLNGIGTLQSRFQQVSDGGTIGGTIYLSRPGRMRIVYDAPSPVLIVADQGQIYYYDKELKQTSRTYTSDTPAYFLLRPDIRLTGDITLTRFARDPKVLRVTLVATDHPDQGQVTLVLADQPLELRQWTVIDAQNKTVTVTLDNPQYGVQLSPQLFYWTDPTSPVFQHGG